MSCELSNNFQDTLRYSLIFLLNILEDVQVDESLFQEMDDLDLDEELEDD